MKSYAICSVLKKYRFKLITIAALGLFWSLRDIVTPYLIKNLVDASQSLNTEKLSTVFFQTIATIISTWVVMELFMRLQGLLLVKTLPRIKLSLSQSLLKQIKSYPYTFFTKNMTGSITSKLTSASQGLESLISISLLAFTPILSYLIFSLVLLATVNSLFFYLFFSWIIIHMYVTWKMGKTSLVKTEILAKSRAQLQGKITDTLFNIFTVKTFCRERYEHSYLNIYQEEECLASQNSQKYLEKIRLILGISSILMLGTTLSASYIYWKKGGLSIGECTLLVTLLLNLTSYLWYLSMELIRFNVELGTLKENMSTLYLRYTPNQNHAPIHCQSTDIQFNNVSHSYDKPVLKNLSFSLSEGKNLAITGLSGTGKTTLINLLLKHLQLQSGEIKIGEHSLSELSPSAIRNYFSLVPQKPYLFNRSIRENIQYGNLEASEEEIIRAAKIANCHDFISNLQNRYDTIIGEQGTKLSGGQNQRVAIARAIIKKSPILILDEPTASLDTKTAEETLKNIIEATKNQTLIVITHNNDVVSLMDETLDINFALSNR